MVMVVARGLTGCLGRALPTTGWHRELDNTSARTCATAFPRRVLYSRGTPGIMSRSLPTAMGAVTSFSGT